MPFGNTAAGSTGVNPALAVVPKVGAGDISANPSAVQQLADAYHHGLVKATDIIGRMSTTASAAGAQVAQNKLAAHQASAQNALVQPSAELAGAQIDQQHADLLYKNAIASYQQFGAMFGEPPVITGADGKPDYATMAEKGQKISHAVLAREFAMRGLAPAQSRDLKQADGSVIHQDFNALGEDISRGSPAFIRYNQLLMNLPGFTSQKPGTSAVRPAAGAAQPEPGPDDAVAPAPTSASVNHLPTVDDMRHELTTVGVSPADAASWPEDKVRQLWGNAQKIKESGGFSQPVQPAAGQASAVAPKEPSAVAAPDEAAQAAPGLGQYVPGLGVRTSESPGLFSTPQAITEDLHKQKAYEAWDMQKGFANSFLSTANKVAAIPPEQQRHENMNQHDLSLAESLIKLYDPQGTIREFKWDKLAESQPVTELIKNWQAKLLNRGAFTPETRARVIQLGIDTIAAKEAAVRPQIQMAAQRAQASGQKPEAMLNPDEMRVLQGQQPALSNQPAAGGQKVISLPSGRRVYWGPDGQLYPAQ